LLVWVCFLRPFYTELINTTKQFDIKQNYIHQNPVKAGIVTNDYDYFYSSANEQSPIKIDVY